MSLESILTVCSEIDILRVTMFADIKKTYPEGTLISFVRYGRTNEGYVSHVDKTTVFLCDSEGTHYQLSPIEDRHLVLEKPLS